MDIKQEVSISKNKIEEVKNKIIEIDIEIKKINSELLKDKHNDDLIEEKKDLLLEKHKLKELQEELESDLVIFAINNGYDVTTEDVAIILDSTTDYVTRKLKQDIEHINIPFDAYKHISDFNKFNILEIYNLHKKSIFFYKEDFKYFLKKHLFNLEDEVDLFFDISDINLDADTIIKESEAYLNSKLKKYEFTNHIDDEELEKILNGSIRLSKLSTIKALVYQIKITNDSNNMRKMISRICEENLLDIERDWDILKKQYKLIDNFYSKEQMNLDKKTSIIHDMQVHRFIESSGYTKYNFVYSGKGMALYDTASGFDVTDEEVKHKKSSNCINEGKLKIKVLNALAYEGIEDEIRAYLKTIQ